MDKNQVTALHGEMSVLASVTTCPRWDERDAKAIGLKQWSVALAAALLIDHTVSSLPQPVPGADPNGFIWLSYVTDKAEFALELSSSLIGDKYRWTKLRDGIKARGSSSSLQDVAEALRATFGHTDQARATHADKGGIARRAND